MKIELLPDYWESEDRQQYKLTFETYIIVTIVLNTLTIITNMKGFIIFWAIMSIAILIAINRSYKKYEQKKEASNGNSQR